ncbi:MAG: NHL repeat-containing protein [Methylococcaceae bacterium]|nr:NHL repeat-containing protein [Methylococcaceae bacterium]
MKQLLTWAILWLLVSLAHADGGLPMMLEKRPIAGDFNQPTAVVADKSGEAFVLDGTRGRVVAISPSGQSRSFAKSGSGSGELHLPLDLVLAEGWVLIADTGNHRIAVFRRSGEFVRNIELQALPDASPEPVALAYHQGIIAWADRRLHRFCRIRLDDGLALGCVGERGETEGKFQFPYQIAVDQQGYWQVLDILNARVQVFDKNGRFFSQTGRFGLSEDELFRPNGLAIAPESATQFVADGYFGWISLFRGGQYLGKLKDAAGETVKFNSPTGLSWSEGKLYVAETGAGKVWALTLGQSASPPSPPEAVKPVALSQKNCILCHLSWATEAAPDLKQPDHDGALTDSSFALCYSCHNGAVMDSRLSIHHGGQHPSLYDREEAKAKRKQAGKRKDKFPDVFPKTADGELSCGTCHTPHTDKKGQDTLYAGHGNAWLRISNKGGDLCERCHESKTRGARETDQAKGGMNHPLSIKLDQPPFQDAPGYTRIDKLHQGLPEKIRQAGGALGRQKELICQSCHQIHGGVGERQLLTVDRAKGELCSQCHPRQFTSSKEEAHKKGVHPVNIKLDEPIRKGEEIIRFVSCETCHKVHQGSQGTALLPEGVSAAEGLCKTCHERQHAEDKDQALAAGVHPVNHKLDEPVEIAGKKIEKVGCLSCHSVHQGKPETAALVESDQEGALCAHCHQDKRTVVGSDHDLRITAKDKPNRLDQLPAKSGVCGACHTLHRGRGLQSRLFAVKRVAGNDTEARDESPFERDRLCLNCHQKGGLGEKKIVRHFSHPHEDMVLRSDKNTMPLLDSKEKAEEFGRIGCITCHEPHVWKHKQGVVGPVELSSNQENIEGRNLDSFLRHKGVGGTFCVNCHGMEGLKKYKYFHDPKRARNKGADYLH